ESLERTKLLALGLTLAGMVLVSGVFKLGQLNLSLLGLATGFGTGVTFATYALFSRYATRRYSPWTCLFYAFSFGLLFLLPLQILSGVDSAPLLGPAVVTSNLFVLGPAAGGWGILLLLALGPTLAGFALYTMGLSHLPASIATIIGTLEPVFSIILAYLVFGEVLDPLQLAGAALILWSVVMLRPRSNPSQEASKRAQRAREEG
ncbi:MAG: DMT family transporter, partial [Rudaea sp.]